MATLPTYNSKASLTTQAPEAIRSGAEAPYEAAAKTLNVVQDVAVKWSNALDTIQYTTAKANYETGVAQLEVKALNDPDYNNSDAYTKELKILKDTNLKGFQNKSVESKMAFEMDHGNQLAQLKIGAIFQKKQIEVGLVKLDEGINALQNKKLLTTSPQEYAKADAEINALLDLNVQARIISPTDKLKMKKEAELSGAENAVYSNPVQGIANLDAGLYDITAKDKRDLIDKGNRLIKARTELADWQLKQTQTQGAFDLSQGLVSGTLTPGQIRQANQAGLIDSETAAIFDGVLTKGDYAIPDSTTLGKPEYFLRLLDENMKDKVEVQKIVKEATTAYGKKELGANQYAYFIQEAKQRFDAERKGELGLSPIQKTIRNSIEGIKAFNKAVTGKEDPKSLAGQLWDFISRIGKGDEPQKAKSDVIEQELNTQIENTKLTLPPQSEKMVAPDGRIFNVAPDKVDQALTRGLKRATK